MHKPALNSKSSASQPPDSRTTGLGHHFQLLVRFLATHTSSLPHTLFKVERWKFHCWYISVYSFTLSLDFVLITAISFIFLVCFSGFCVLLFIDIALIYALYFSFSLGGQGFTLCFIKPCSWPDLSVTQTSSAFLLMDTPYLVSRRPITEPSNATLQTPAPAF